MGEYDTMPRERRDITLPELADAIDSSGEIWSADADEIAQRIRERSDEMTSRLAKLEAVAEAAAYMDAAFDVMVSVRTEPKRLENARDMFAEKRREFRAAVAVLDKEPTNG